MFFGVVRHVIRTQCDGPSPDPDVEGWLAAGRPEDQRLAGAWDLLNLGRYGARTLPATPRTGSPDPGIFALDEVLRRWPHLPTFVNSYARVERFVEDSSITLPPLTA